MDTYSAVLTVDGFVMEDSETRNRPFKRHFRNRYHYYRYDVFVVLFPEMNYLCYCNLRRIP